MGKECPPKQTKLVGYTLNSLQDTNICDGLFRGFNWTTVFQLHSLVVYGVEWKGVLVNNEFEGV